MFLVDALVGLLRPARCLACGVPVAWPCCAGCLPSEPGAVGPWLLAADPEVGLWTLGPYRDALRTAVLAGKLDGQPAALDELGRRLGAALAVAGAGADLVTHIAAGRVAGPPRDHARRIAGGVATALGLPLVDLLAPAGGRDLGRARRAARGQPSAPPAPGASPPPRRRAGPAGRRPRHHRRHPRRRGRRPPLGRRPPGRGRRPRRRPVRRRRVRRRIPVRARLRSGLARAATLSRAVRPPTTGPLAGSALLTQVALCGCDPFSCVESGQYDQRAMKEDGPHAE